MKKKNLQKVVLSATILAFLCACYFGDNPTFYNRELPSNLKLSAMDKKENLILWEPMDVGSGGSYSGVVGPTIYEIGWTEDFVIVKTHPNLSHILNNGASSDFLSDSELAVIRDSICYIFRTLENQRDSSKRDPKKTFKRNDKWWSELYQVRLDQKDSLMPFKKLTYWHIVEIKKSNKVFTATSEESFNNERKRLNVPDTLSFFLKFDELK